MTFIPKNNNGQTTMANSQPVVIASDQTSIPVNLSTVPLATNAATETGIQQIVTAIKAQIEVSTSVWTDNSGSYYVRRDSVNEGTGVITVYFTDPTGTTVTPGAGLKPLASSEKDFVQTLFDATASGTGYTTGDILSRLQIIDTNQTSPTSNILWFNITQNTSISAPTSGTYVQSNEFITANQGGTWNVGITGTVPLPTGAATAANQATEITALNLIHTDLTSPTPFGTNAIGQVTVNNLDVALSTRLKPSDTLTKVATVDTITNPLPAGTNLLGKVGIDQTTPGTTNKVSIGTDGTVSVNTALPSGTNSIGQVTANAGTNLNTSALALEAGGNLAAINTKTPALGQALAAASVPVVLPSAQISALTPPAAITGFNLESTQVLIKDKTDNIDVLLSTRLKPADTLAGVNTLGTITNALPAGSNNIGSVNVQGGNTTAVKVDGSAVTQPVSLSSLPLATNAATETGIQQIVSAIKAQMEISTSVWTDDSGAYYVRRDSISYSTSGTAIAVYFTDPTGTTVTPGIGLKPLSSSEKEIVQTLFDATASGTGYTTGDILARLQIIDPNLASPSSTVLWFNITQNTSISAPTSGTYVQSNEFITANQGGTWNVGITGTVPLPTGASTEATLAAIKAKTDNIDVALSTRTKPTDTQIVDGSAVTQPISASSLPLPSGAAQDGVDGTGIVPPTGGSGIRGWLSGIYEGIKNGSYPSAGTNSNSISQVSIDQSNNGTSNRVNIGTDGTVTVNAGTNLNTSALALEAGGNLAAINTKIPALGQALDTASVPVVLTAAQLAALTPIPSGSTSNVLALDGTDGTGIVPPAGGSGIRGWLSGIYNELNTSLSVDANTIAKVTDKSLVTRIAPMKKMRATFSAAVASGSDTSVLPTITIGTGQTVSQSGGNLILTAGTTINSETILRSVESFTDSMIIKYSTILSQRIVNNNFYVEMVDIIGDNLAITINSATSVTITIPNNTFTSQNVGQSMYLGKYSGTGTFVPRRYAIASVSGNDVTFTVAGFAAGSGTCSVFGWNYHQVLYDSTVATNTKYDTQRNGYNSGTTTCTISTTASAGHLGIMTNEDGNAAYLDQLTASLVTIQSALRATRVTNIPDEKAELYLQIRSVNGSVAPATNTTWTIGMISVENYTPQPVSIANIKPQGTIAGLPVSVQNTIPVSQSGNWTVMPGNTVNTSAWLTNPLNPAVSLTGDTGAKTVTFNGATQTNANGKGALIVLNLGAVTGTGPTLAMKLQGSADGGTTWVDLPNAFTSTLNSSGAYGIYMYPGITTVASTGTTGTTATVNCTLPRTWRAVYTIAGSTPSFTITNVQVSYHI